MGRKDLKWKVPQVGAWPLSFPFFINGAKDAAEGAMMAQTFIAEPSNERRASFLTAYKRKFNQPMAVPMAAAQAYDTTYLLVFSLFGVRDGNPERARPSRPHWRTSHASTTAWWPPMTSRFSLDDKDAITANMLVMGKVSNGVVTFANPADAKRNLFVQRKK